MSEFYRNKLKTSFSIDEIITAHYFRYSKKFTIFGEIHNFYEFVYVNSGRVEIQNGNTTFILNSNEAFLHRPNIFHSIKAIEPYSNTIVFTFDGKYLDSLKIYDKVITCEQKDKTIMDLILAISRETFIEKLDIIELKKMTISPSSNQGNLQEIKNLLEVLLIELSKNKVNMSFSSLTKKQQICKKIEDYLFNNYDKVLSLTDVARAVGYSVSYIKRIMSEEKGIGIMEFHLQIKIERAKVLIKENQLSFTEISNKIGFCSPQYFTEAFKKLTNMTPKEYLNNIKNNELI